MHRVSCLTIACLASLLIAACGAQDDDLLTEDDVSCLGEKCDDDSTASRDERDIAVRVHSTYSKATAFGLDPYLGFLLDRTPVVAPIAFKTVRSWVCDESKPLDFLSDSEQSEETGIRWQKETKNLFGCGFFQSIKVEFRVEPELNPDYGVWYDDGDIIIGLLADYPS